MNIDVFFTLFSILNTIADLQPFIESFCGGEIGRSGEIDSAMRLIEKLIEKDVELFWGYLYPFCNTFFTKANTNAKANTNTNVFVDNFVNKPPPL